MTTTVTVIGGGTGSFNVLTGLRNHTHLAIRSVVTMMDSGGDSGRLRDEFGVLPPGDVRRCLVALSEESALLRNLFTFRFDEDPLSGRSFGNLFWSPGGTQLLFVFRTAYNAPASESEADIKKSEKEPVYRHIKRLWYRLDADG